ncbi:MAG: hypothetical protein NE334_13745 [Lentisphaeraceae bacterium]|nr:hypothetical protein [Lentisphaeraceae bacterium]
MIRDITKKLATSTVLLSMLTLQAAETDQTQTPNAEGAGMNKSLTEQVGVGRGDVNTPDSSLYIINRDPFRAIVRGRNIFQRKFTAAQGVGPRTNDGIGDIAADASHGAGFGDSCASCHANPEGSAGFGGNIFSRPDGRDTPHLFGLGIVEIIADEMTSTLRDQKARASFFARIFKKKITVKLIAKGVKFGKITAFKNGTFDVSAVEGVDEDLRVKPFFAEGLDFNIRNFAVGAFNAEMGLESSDSDLQHVIAGGTLTTPSGFELDGAKDPLFGDIPALSEVDDNDDDGVVNEIDQSIVDYTEFYLLNYFVPATYKKSSMTRKGLKVMKAINCTSCHKQNMTIWEDRRVASVETKYDAVNGGINQLFAEATPLFHEVTVDAGPTLKLPNKDLFVVRNLFSDLKRHDLGPKFWERQFDGSIKKKFVTEPLWGVGTTAPYGHDGRSINLEQVILRHGGEAEASKVAFENLNETDKQNLLSFLSSLVLFPPPDTASNLNPENTTNPDYPVRGHGSIKLSILFNDSTDKE